jgi:hypothetical protein
LSSLKSNWRPLISFIHVIELINICLQPLKQIKSLKFALLASFSASLRVFTEQISDFLNFLNQIIFCLRGPVFRIKSVWLKKFGGLGPLIWEEINKQYENPKFKFIHRFSISQVEDKTEITIFSYNKFLLYLGTHYRYKQQTPVANVR